MQVRLAQFEAADVQALGEGGAKHLLGRRPLADCGGDPHRTVAQRLGGQTGQTWQVSDGSSASYYLRDPKVTVRRAPLGGFDMEIEGARKSPRVRRVE